MQPTARPFRQLRLMSRLAENVFLGGCVPLQEGSCLQALSHKLFTAPHASPACISWLAVWLTCQLHNTMHQMLSLTGG